MAERNRLLKEYFPVRTARVLADITKYLPAYIVDGIKMVDGDGLMVEGDGLTVEGYYNLQGQRVAKPKRGIYVRNGKKVVVR